MEDRESRIEDRGSKPILRSSILYPLSSVSILIVLALFVLGAAFAGFLAPYDYRAQYRDSIHVPPMSIHFFDEAGQWVGPYVHKYRRADGPGRRYDEDRSAKYRVEFFVQGGPYRLFGTWESSTHLLGVAGARLHLLGTDHLGRDVFSRLMYGSQITLSVALASLLAALLLGVGLGCVSGYFGGTLDAVLMRLGELVGSVPAIFLILAFRAAFPLDLAEEKAVAMLIMIFALVSWPEVSRLVRATALSLASREFVLSAKAAGASDWRILVRHITPHALTPAIIQAAIIVPSFVLGEAALSFLGVGVREPRPSWGNMLAAAQDLTVLTNYWWMLTPGAAIFALTASLNALGDAARDALDPRQKHGLQGWG
jgi:peptide/nickel transport system permease protein